MNHEQWTDISPFPFLRNKKRTEQERWMPLLFPIFSFNSFVFGSFRSDPLWALFAALDFFSVSFVFLLFPFEIVFSSNSLCPSLKSPEGKRFISNKFRLESKRTKKCVAFVFIFPVFYIHCIYKMCCLLHPMNNALPFLFTLVTVYVSKLLSLYF